ncbi:MAG: DUF4876 domain-containing protein [Myxococcota bacterium]
MPACGEEPTSTDDATTADTTVAGDDQSGTDTTEGSDGGSDGETDGGSGSDGDSSSDGDSGDSIILSPHGNLVVDEVYFTGSPPFGGVDHYFSDQFIAIYNISSEPVAAGGLVVGDVFGPAGEINPGDTPHGLADDEEHVYMRNLWRIPGAPQDVIIEPGERLVIAQDGTNHSPFSTVDLSGADFETYVADSGNDEDYPTVDNLELLHYNAGFDWLITVFGPSVVIASLEEDEDLDEFDHEGWTLIQLPAAAVVDGVDIVMDAQSGGFKRLPSTIDQGFTFATGTYTGEAVLRRRSDGQPVDTDDSSADFELTGQPDPWRS